MRAILRVWTLINIPDNVITADTGTEVLGSRLASHYPEAAQDPGSESDPYHGDHETKPRHQNLQTALIWEHCEAGGDYYGDYWSYHRAAIIQATQHSMWEEANETLLTDTQIRSWEWDRQWRETWDNPNWNHKLKSSLQCLCLRMTSSIKGGKVSLSSRITIPSDCTFIYPLSGAASGLQLERVRLWPEDIIIARTLITISDPSIPGAAHNDTPHCLRVSFQSRTDNWMFCRRQGVSLCPCALDFSWISIQFVSERMSVAVSGWGSVSCSLFSTFRQDYPSGERSP